MISFGDLNIQKVESKPKVLTQVLAKDKELTKLAISNITREDVVFPLSDTKIDFKKDILGKAPKRSKEELRLIEPGYKIGTGEFPTLAIYCDQCERVTGHACKSAKNRKICLICKTITKLARNG